MIDPVYLTSLQNPRLKALAARRRHNRRDNASTILVEGYDELKLALSAGLVPRSVYYSTLLTTPTRLAGVVKNLPGKVEQVILSPEAFTKVSYRDSPDGWLGEFNLPTVALGELELGPSPLVMIAEAIEKPGNLGALLRTADAVGASVIAADAVTDWANPNVVRASKGTVMTVPVSEATTADTITWLRQNKLKLIVATPEADTVYTAADLTGSVAIAVGAEHLGVSDELKSAADVLVSIPMRGHIDSLNASIAGALLVYEAVRQRSL